MANEIEEFLEEEMVHQDDHLRLLTARLEELAGIDCPLGVCVFDHRMQSVEHEIYEIQHRRNVIEDTLRTVRQQVV